jgi:hypothetical protein
MALQVEALFASDARGRLLHPNEPGCEAQPPPRFFLGRTRHGHLWRFGADVPDGTVRELARLAAAERGDWPLERPPERLEAMRARLAADAPIERVHHGPAFRFPEALAGDAGADAVLLTADRADRLGDGFPALRAALADCQPCLAVLEGGRAVSACWLARRSARAAEAGVGTLPGFRGRGLAARATAAWARAVRELGLLPLYSTEWSNRSSRGVAARLGLTLYGVDLHLR